MELNLGFRDIRMKFDYRYRVFTHIVVEFHLTDPETAFAGAQSSGARMLRIGYIH